MEEERCFFFDSLPFRSAAILANKQKPDKGLDMNDVWEENVNSWIELLEYIDDLSPHDIENTISLQKARISVTAIADPLQEITNNCRANTDTIEQCIKKAEIAKINPFTSMKVIGKIIRLFFI